MLLLISMIPLLRIGLGFLLKLFENLLDVGWQGQVHTVLDVVPVECDLNVATS